MTEKSSEIEKKPRGGPRAGAGRPKGRRSAATLKREARVAAEVAEALSQQGTSEEIEQCDPFTALEFVLRNYWRAGNLSGMVAVARELLPYTRPKLSSTDPILPIPADMMADPPPTPDEIGPENPIL